jgi:protoporphyrinogen/coproporphyrinogen III oxidase
VRTGTPARNLDRHADGWRVGTDDGAFAADAVLVTVPAGAAAGLLDAAAPEAAGLLGAIRYASTVLVVLVYPPGTGETLPRASGFVAPSAPWRVRACTFVSRKWPEAQHGGRAVVRCYLGGAGREAELEADDTTLVRHAAGRLHELLGLPESAEASAVVRWASAMPQYEVGHPDRARRIRSALPPGIFIAGQATDGVGIADCVRGASDSSAAVSRHLAAPAARDTGATSGQPQKEIPT